jgi:hypothetical protein
MPRYRKASPTDAGSPGSGERRARVEQLCSILERGLLRRDGFDSVEHVGERVIAFINDYTTSGQRAFRWTDDGRLLRAATGPLTAESKDSSKPRSRKGAVAPTHRRPT